MLLWFKSEKLFQNLCFFVWNCRLRKIFNRQWMAKLHSFYAAHAHYVPFPTLKLVYTATFIKVSHYKVEDKINCFHYKPREKLQKMYEAWQKKRWKNVLQCFSCSTLKNDFHSLFFSFWKWISYLFSQHRVNKLLPIIFWRMFSALHFSCENFRQQRKCFCLTIWLDCVKISN